MVKIEMFEGNDGLVPVETYPYVQVKQEPVDGEIQVKLEPEYIPNYPELNQTELNVIIGYDCPPYFAILEFTEENDAMDDSFPVDAEEKKDEPVQFPISTPNLNTIPAPSTSFFASVSSSSSSDSSSPFDLSPPSESEGRKRPTLSRSRSPSPKRHRTTKSPSPRRHRSPSPHDRRRDSYVHMKDYT